MKTELLSCPFCGNEAHIVDDLITFYGQCGHCGATGAVSSYRNGAIERWNRRAQPAQAGQVLTDVVRDAERYRWLFSGHTDDELNADMLAGRQPVMTVQDQLIADFSAWYTLKETADAKIDAAIAQQKGSV